jgi:hypothetical protein
LKPISQGGREEYKVGRCQVLLVPRTVETDKSGGREVYKLGRCQVLLFPKTVETDVKGEGKITSWDGVKYCCLFREGSKPMSGGREEYKVGRCQVLVFVPRRVETVM